MGLFEDVMENTRAAVNAVGQKAGQIVDISKLRINAADLNHEISKRFESLGRLVYDAYKTENSAEGLVQECIQVIENLYEQLDEVNEQIAVAKNKVKCKHCGFENIQEAVYCNRCGAKLLKEEVPVEPVEDAAPVQEKAPEGSDPVADENQDQAEDICKSTEDQSPVI